MAAPSRPRAIAYRLGKAWVFQAYHANQWEASAIIHLDTRDEVRGLAKLLGLRLVITATQRAA